MTMPADVESPMYTTARQEVRVAVRVADLSPGDEVDLSLGDKIFGGESVVGGAVGASRVESLISAEASLEGGDGPLAAEPTPATPARPMTSSARTPSATTEVTPAATRCL